MKQGRASKIVAGFRQRRRVRPLCPYSPAPINERRGCAVSIPVIPSQKTKIGEVGSSRMTGLETHVTTRLSKNSDSVWIVTDDCVRPVPRFYPLSKSTIMPRGTSVGEMAQKVSNFFRVQSIEAAYDDAKASAVATTPDNVKLSIRMFRGDDGAAGPISEIILEVQKIRGCSVDFRRVCRALFEAVASDAEAARMSPGAEGSLADPRNAPNSAGNVRNHATGDAQCDETGGCAPPTDTAQVIDAASIAVDLLRKKNPDSKCLGLDVIRLLTDTVTARRADACYTSSLVLFGNETFGFELRDMIKSLINTQETDRGTSEVGDPDQDEIKMQSFTPDHDDCMRTAAVQILANALKVASEGGLLVAQVGRGLCSWAELMPSLVDDLDNAATRPHLASLSALCLRHLIFWPTEEFLASLRPVLMKAYEFGKERHLALEKEALNLQMMLDTLMHRASNQRG